jgi:hypothetical protein
MTPVPTQSSAQTALRAFLLAVLPAVGPDGNPVDVLAAQVNRIPEPRGSSFVLMTPLRFERIETNFDSYADAAFTGSIAGTVMTITAVDPRFASAKIAKGSSIFGVGVTSGTVVSAVLSGSGQVGTYAVGPSQNVGGGTLSAGVELIQQAQKWTFQLDFHGDPANDISGDMATTVSTLFRDDFATNQFANQSPSYGVAPLYADDPRQIPFHNDQSQVENRWVLECCLQVNAVVTVPRQFADEVEVKRVAVDAFYPP